jgi:hypothetical protein
MTIRQCLLLVSIVVVPLVCASRASAQQAMVLLNASPSVIMADGRSSTTITSTISGLNGEQVADGTIVRFTSTSGILSAASVASVGGIARVTLTSSPVAGFATVTASFIGNSGSGSGQFQVEFTSDKTLANTDEGESDWIRISSADYLAYSADSELVDASSAKQGVKFSYRGLVISADALQADLSSGTVRARNAVMQRGHQELKVMMLNYSLTAGSGQALSDALPGSRTVEPVTVSGTDLSMQPLDHRNIQPTGFTFVDISSSRVIITATAVAVRMNDKIQLRHASVYIDSKRVVSMPYQIMPLQTTEIFGQQVLGYGSDGLFLDVPYYASVSPKSTGAFYLRSTAASQEDGTYYSGRQGLAVDYVEKYGDFDGKSAGTLNLMGISRSDWGASWTHSQQFSNSLKGYFYVDVPEHDSLFSSSNLVQQMHGFSLNLTATDSNSPAVLGYGSSEQDIETYLQTDSHRLEGTPLHGLFYSTGLTFRDSFLHSVTPGFGNSTQDVSTRSAGMNLFTSPFRLSPSTQLSDSVNISRAAANGGGTSGTTAQAELNLNTKFNSMATSTMSYSFSHDPVSGNLLNNPLLPTIFKPVTNQSNYSFSLNLTPKSNRWNGLLSSTYSNPLGDKSMTAGLNFFPTSNWIVGVDENYSSFSGVDYRDLELSIGRRIGTREMQFYWSSVDRRIRFNMGTAQF